MGSFGIGHWLIVAIVLVLVLGSGRLSAVMGDAAKGIKAFKKGMSDDDAPGSGTVKPGQPSLPEAPRAYAAAPAYTPEAAVAQPQPQPAPPLPPYAGTEPRQP